jgi:beta-lactamase class D
MRSPNLSVFILILLVLGLNGCKEEKTVEEKTVEVGRDFGNFYRQYNVDGTFILYDQNKDKFYYHNQEQSGAKYRAASTFKIINSLIGLETGVIKDEYFVIQWDGVNREISSWNSDHDLKTAFKNSTVWYYQELARRVGGEQMKHWLDTVKYGNADTSGGIDKFWLSGGLRISPEQQIDFLRKLHDNELPFSQRSMDIVKSIMIAKDTLGYVVRAKTGWSRWDNEDDIGWYVGYFETKDNVYYFANCIRTSDRNHKDFLKARIEIVYDILENLKYINQ